MVAPDTKGGGGVEITIKGKPKEIAALLLAIEKQQAGKIPKFYSDIALNTRLEIIHPRA